MTDLQKTLQCATCEENVEFTFSITEDDDGITSSEFETTKSGCTCRVSYLDWLRVVKNKVDGGFQIDGRIFGSESYDLNYGHTVSRSL